MPTVLLQVCVHRENQIVRDTVVWDVFQPYNTAQQYAGTVCECLGLRFDWYQLIAASVDSMLHDIREVRVRVCGVLSLCAWERRLSAHWLQCLPIQP